jgi:hypothetical protein
MSEVVRSTCPGCQRTLNIPAAWAGKTVKCKHCGSAMLVQAVPAVAGTSRLPVETAAPTWEALPPEAPLPDYVPPVAPAPGGGGSKYVSAFDTRERYRGRGKYSGPKKNGWIKFVVFGLLVACLGGAGFIAFNKLRHRPVETGPVTNNGGDSNVPGNSGDPNATGPFPRRMLAISVHSYMYANPLHNGDSGFALDDNRRTGTDAAIRRLAERWRVPKDQLYHLTDARQAGDKKEDKKPAKDMKDGEMPPKKGAVAEMAPPKRASKVPPLKSVIEGTITQFLDSCRAQDRIVFVFCGHALEKKGEAYLVPLEGDLDELDTLIPLKWFYEKLGACKAQEKVVIYDVCRFHPERGLERPSPGPMTEGLEKALHDSPEGVSVVTSCSKDEQSLELDYLHLTTFNFNNSSVKGTGFDLYGSFFLSLIHAASQAGVLAPEKKLPLQSDEFPLERFTTWMQEKVGETVKFNLSGRTQTVKTTIKKPAQTVAYDGSEPVPARFDFPAPPPSADPRAVMAIVKEVQLPSVKSFRDDAPPPSISDVLPFSEESLKDYLAGELKLGDKANEFQQAIVEAVEEMRKIRTAGSGTELPEEFKGETNDRAKAELRKTQEVPARVEAILQDHLDKLEGMADQKDKQVKRWQVHYEYIVAQLKLRLCYANQYNLALANVRGGKLPDLKEGQTGYRLTAETTLDKNTPANYKEMFNDARKSLTEIAKSHPNTPWALLAKSDRTVAIGLRLTGSSGSSN